MQSIGYHRSRNIRWAGLHLYGSFASWSRPSICDISESALRRAAGIENPEWTHRISSRTERELAKSLMLSRFEELDMDPDAFKALTESRCRAELERLKAEERRKNSRLRRLARWFCGLKKR